jgi:hypothetical protein
MHQYEQSSLSSVADIEKIVMSIYALLRMVTGTPSTDRFI